MENAHGDFCSRLFRHPLPAAQAMNPMVGGIRARVNENRSREFRRREDISVSGRQSTRIAGSWTVLFSKNPQGVGKTGRRDSILQSYAVILQDDYERPSSR